MNKQQRLGIIVDSIKNYLASYTQTQLAITLISLPVLVSWGLGFSLMTLVSNLLFAPVLTIFLILSSLVLFTTMLNIPQTGLIALLNWFTPWWDRVMHLGTSEWLIQCARPPVIILLLFPIIGLAIIHMRWFNTRAKRIIAFSLAIIVFFMVCKIYQHQADTFLTKRFHEKLYSIKLANSNSIIMVDEGYFSQKKSVDKAVDYQLRQWVIKNYGYVRIKEWRCTHPTVGGFLAAAHICSRWSVDEVWVPYFQAPENKAVWRAYFELKRVLEEKHIRFVRYTV